MQELQTTENEEELGEYEVLDNHIHFPAGIHRWRQQGTYLVCRNCPLTHAVHIGADKIMIGEDDAGKPIMRKR